VSRITKASFDPGCRVDGTAASQIETRRASARLPSRAGSAKDLRIGPGTNPDRAQFVLLQILPR
jgi:hypothetical protein